MVSDTAGSQKHLRCGVLLSLIPTQTKYTLELTIIDNPVDANCLNTHTSRLCVIFVSLSSSSSLFHAKPLTPPHYTTLHNVVDTIVLRDSIYIREFIKGDTVFRDRVAYRDRWRTHLVHDTVVKTASIVQVIEHPPRALYPALSQNMHDLVLSSAHRMYYLFLC